MEVRELTNAELEQVSGGAPANPFNGEGIKDGIPQNPQPGVIYEGTDDLKGWAKPKNFKPIVP